MVTDPLFYRLFETSPETFFVVLGMTVETAGVMAKRYQYEALEFKETSHRVDGVFLPREPGLPVYFLEVQFYRLPTVFAELLVKAYTYLKQHDPGQAFCAVILFSTGALAPKERVPYQPLLDAGMIRCINLDELPDVPNAPLGLSILSLIQKTESDAPATARELIVRTKKEIGDEALRVDLVELIETVIIYRLPLLTREEIQTMLQVHDIRETKVYQEAKEEGIQEGIEKGIEEERSRTFQEKLRTVAKMAALNITAEDIADVLGLDIAIVRKEIARG